MTTISPYTRVIADCLDALSEGQFGRIKMQLEAGNATAGEHAPGQDA